MKMDRDTQQSTPEGTGIGSAWHGCKQCTTYDVLLMCVARWVVLWRMHGMCSVDRLYKLCCSGCSR